MLAFAATRAMANTEHETLWAFMRDTMSVPMVLSISINPRISKSQLGLERGQNRFGFSKYFALPKMAVQATSLGPGCILILNGRTCLF